MLPCPSPATAHRTGDPAHFQGSTGELTLLSGELALIARELFYCCTQHMFPTAIRREKVLYLPWARQWTGPGDVRVCDPDLRTWEQENWLHPLLQAMLDELAEAVQENSLLWWRYRRAGGLTNPATTQAQNQGLINKSTPTFTTSMNC